MSRRLTSLLGVVVVMALAAALLLLLDGPAPRRVSAEFPSTVGLFEGSDVRVMGMRVGHVERITPHGTGVRVDMVYDSRYRLPEGVRAVVIAPSVISDRFVQLTPAYTAGPALASGAVIPRRDTRVPVELDTSLAATTDLMKALGPDGANRNGALAAALHTLASTMSGTGSDARDALRELARVSDVFAAQAPAEADTVRQLGTFTAALAGHDRDVAGFTDALAAVADGLAADSGQIDTLLRTLAGALGEVAGFVAENRSALVTDVRRLRTVATALAAERRALTEIVDIAPLAFTDLDETYDSQAQAVRTRANFGEIAKILDRAVCDALLKQAGPALQPVCDRLHGLIDSSGVLR